jgi:hypothetical protein
LGGKSKRGYNKVRAAIAKLRIGLFAGLMCTPKEKPHSYIGFMARAEGKDGKDLLDEIIQSAIKRLGLRTRE